MDKITCAKIKEQKFVNSDKPKEIAICWEWEIVFEYKTQVESPRSMGVLVELEVYLVGVINTQGLPKKIHAHILRGKKVEHEQII